MNLPTTQHTHLLPPSAVPRRAPRHGSVRWVILIEFRNRVDTSDCFYQRCIAEYGKCTYIYICKGSLKLHLQKVHYPEDARSAYKKLAPVESLFLGSAVLPKPTRTHLPATRGQPVPRLPLNCPAGSCFREESSRGRRF